MSLTGDQLKYEFTRVPNAVDPIAIPVGYADLHGDGSEYGLKTQAGAAAPNTLAQQTINIVAGASGLSGAITVPPGQTLVALFVPAGWVAANITAQASSDGGTTWFDVHGADGTEYIITAAAARAIQVPPEDLAGFHTLKLRSGTSAVPVDQTATRTLTVITKSV